MLLSLACCDIFGLRQPERPLCLSVGGTLGEIFHSPGCDNLGWSKLASMLEPSLAPTREEGLHAALRFLPSALLVFCPALFFPGLSACFQILLVLHPLVFHLASLNSGFILAYLSGFRVPAHMPVHMEGVEVRLGALHPLPRACARVAD